MRKSREARAHRQVELQHAPGKFNTSCDRGPQHADPQRAIPEFAVAFLISNFHDLTPVPRARSAFAFLANLLLCMLATQLRLRAGIYFASWD